MDSSNIIFSHWNSIWSVWIQVWAVAKKCSLHQVDNPVHFDVHTYRHTYKYTQLNIIPRLMSIFGERTNFLRISKLWTLRQTNIVIILSQCLPIAWVIIFFSLYVSLKRAFLFPLFIFHVIYSLGSLENTGCLNSLVACWNDKF